MPNKAVQLVQLLRSTKRDQRLGTVILFVTSRCNAFCKTCFYHAELNQPGDLTFEQTRKGLAHDAGDNRSLAVWRGAHACVATSPKSSMTFVKNNGVDRVIIPTNGLIKTRVVRDC